MIESTAVNWLRATHALTNRISELAPDAADLRDAVDALVALAKQGVELGALPVAHNPSDEPANGATGSPSPVPTPAASPERDIFGEILRSPEFRARHSLEVEEHEHG